MTRLLSVIRWSLILLVVAYALSLVLLQVAWRTSAAELWWVQLLNVFGLWLYLPLPLCCLLAVFARSRLAVLALVIPLVSFGWEYGTLFVPKRAVVEGVPLRVMTWNLLASNGAIDSVDRTLREQQPDLVAVQELTAEQVDSLAPLLADRYPYHELYPAGTAGLGVWSRFPIVDAIPADNRPEGCRCQQVTLSVDGFPVRLVNVHPFAPDYGLRYIRPLRRVPRIPLPRSFSTALQEPNYDRLVLEAQRGDEPLIMVGDFNLTDRQRNYWRLRRYLQDAYREAGQGFGLTFPNKDVYIGRFRVPPLIRIYILHSPGVAATRAYTVAVPTSDHRAVVADLVVATGVQAATGHSLDLDETE